MKSLLVTASCLLVALSYPLSAQPENLPSKYTETITKWIEKENARTKPKRAPYAEVDNGISIYTGDLDLDGDEDIVANYGVTYGGNGITQFLAVFLNNRGKVSKGYKREVGTSGTVMLDSIVIQNGIIVCTTSVWKEDDAHCCPSGEGMVKYVFRKGKIKPA